MNVMNSHAKERAFLVKRIISIVVFIVLVVTVIIVSNKYRSLLEVYNWQQTNANIEVKADLNTASCSFGGNSLTDKTSKSYNYNQAMSMLATASQLYDFSTYKKNNNGLSVTLDNLWVLMENDDYKEIIIQKSQSIADDLQKLSYNPEDKQATQNLVNLIEIIRQKK